MLDRTHSPPGPNPASEEYVTIIGPNMTEVMRQFHDCGLNTKGYAIAGRVERHRFALADATGAHDLFDGTPMLAATFVRHRAA